MNPVTRAQFEARAKVMKAMAHPSRLFIIDRLSLGEHCVCDLRDMIGADMSTISKHLSVLKEAGIVATEKRGVQVFLPTKGALHPQIHELRGSGPGTICPGADGDNGDEECLKQGSGFFALYLAITPIIR